MNMMNMMYVTIWILLLDSVLLLFVTHTVQPLQSRLLLVTSRSLLVQVVYQVIIDKSSTVVLTSVCSIIACRQLSSSSILLVDIVFVVESYRYSVAVFFLGVEITTVLLILCIVCMWRFSYMNPSNVLMWL